MKPIFQ